MTKRDKKQEEIKAPVITAAKQLGFIHHTIIASTGIGKSKIAMDLIQALKEIIKFDKILILVDNTKLRDSNWKDDFDKWGLSDMYKSIVEMNTYQTAYKWDKELSKYLIIADEADFAFTSLEGYGKFFKTYKNCNILGMTGYVTENKRSFMEKHLPCLFEYTQEQAQSDGILNSTPITFVKYDLGKIKNITIEYANKTKKFVQSENASYNYTEDQIRKTVIALSKANAVGDSVKIDKLHGDLKRQGNYRASVIYKSLASVNMTKGLLKYISKLDDVSKTVIFSKRTEQSDKISPHTYHNKKSKEVNEKTFNDFNSGLIREMALVDKINRGVNMVNLNYAIWETFDGSDTKLRQKLGRMMRLDPSDLANLFILLPYYMKKTKNGSYEQAPTVAVRWAMDMLSGWDISQAKIWDYRTIKSNL